MSGLSSRSVAAFFAVSAVVACGVGTAQAQGSNFPPPRFVHFTARRSAIRPDPPCIPINDAMIAVHRVGNRMAMTAP